MPAMKMAETEVVTRVAIEQTLSRPLAPIPAGLRSAFHDHQNQHARRFLLWVNLLGQAAFLSYALADWLIVPDIAQLSLLMRTLYTLLVFGLTQACFRWCRDIRLLDLLLPACILVAAMLWFWLLARSASPAVTTYQYAALIFIVLANLCVQVHFLPALLMSMLISAVIVAGVHHLVAGQDQALLVFCLVYLPVLFFSLFISFSATLDRRRAFLHSLLDAMTRTDLAQANSKLQTLAHTDPLTGISNRRQFDLIAEREVARARRQRESICVLMLDVDFFKRVNDRYGHDAGDRVLCALASTARRMLREPDLLARFGGEEFIVLLPETGPGDAMRLAERMRLAVQAERLHEALPASRRI
ncbi:MAG: hypothetical protein RLZZ22_1042, partial [Pseudomonadota bacterium]